MLVEKCLFATKNMKWSRTHYKKRTVSHSIKAKANLKSLMSRIKTNYYATYTSKS